MDEMGALNEALEIIEEWKPASDVYALKYYPFVTGAAGSLSAAFIHSFYRKAVKLRNQVLIVTAIPIVILPVCVSTILHHQFVQTPLVLQKFQCPVCLEMRAGALQLFAGFFYPMVLAPVSCFHFASRLLTYNIPYLTEPKELWKTYVKFTRPGLSRFYVLAGIQVVVGMGITHLEAQNLFTVLSKLSRMERQVQEHKAEMESSAEFH